jgi:hypothetical protein
MHYISILSTLVTFAFAAAVIGRYRSRRGAHLLLWGIGLLLYGLGTLSEAVMLFTFHPFVLRVWYLSGAMLTAAWLGQGTIHLLVRRRGVAPALTVGLLLVSLLSLGLVMVAPLTSAAAAYDLNQPASAQYQDILVRNGATIALTILLNLYGTVALVGGAIYSAYLFWRKRVLMNRLVGNILIAAGALMPAMGGTFLKAGLADWLYISEFLGAVLMYLGFLQATATRPALESSTQPSPSSG